MIRFTSAAAVTGLAAALALACGVPALADVKAGVDAWAAGDFARAVAEWKAPAARGDADAMFNLAQAYRLGRGVPEDMKQAEALYAKAAAKGHLQAADNYGLLLFQDGRREAAIPYVTAAAERGDPRAQYLLGIAHFNGDLLPKDWVRAYALLTLANGAGLPQAAQGISQMDDFIPLSQRQQAQSLAATMRSDADAKRASAMAAVDLEAGPAAVASSPQVAAAPPPGLLAPRLPEPISSVAVAPSIAAAEAAVAEAIRATGTESPATAGADFARPSTSPARAARRPARDTAVAVAAESPPSRTAPAPPAGGAWKVQLGAFSVPGNAERLWGQLAGLGALAGKSKVTVPAGRLTRLLASGWPSEAAAQTACNSLKAAGQGCIVTR